MPDTGIFAPMLAMVALTFAVWAYMYYRRLGFLFANDIDPQSLTTREDASSVYPPDVVWPSDNLKNLFELPVLFYATCLYLFVSGSVDAIHIVSAWLFVALRAVHSGIHCLVNVVKLRFAAYALGAVVLWFMIGRAIWSMLAA